MNSPADRNLKFPCSQPVLRVPGEPLARPRPYAGLTAFHCHAIIPPRIRNRRGHPLPVTANTQDPGQPVLVLHEAALNRWREECAK